MVADRKPVFGEQEKGLPLVDSRILHSFAGIAGRGQKHGHKSPAAAVAHQGLYMQLDEYN